MHSRLLTRKLVFLRQHLVEEALGIGTLVVTSMLEDPDSLCIVQECRDLEEEYGTKFTDKILADADAVIMADVRKEIRKRDKETQLERCAEKIPHLLEVVKKGGSWPTLWDVALHLGSRQAAGLQHLTRILAHHGHGLKPHPTCMYDECSMIRSLIL